MSRRIVIPARLGSSRLPGKVMADLGGRPVLSHVIEAAQQSQLGEVWVASDSQQVLDLAQGCGAQAGLTRDDHPSGSDRIAELASAQGWADDTVIVNLQGDEPFMSADLLRAVAGMLETDPRADWATAATPVHDAAQWRDPSCVKVVCAGDGAALYFSRAPIPHERDATSDSALPAVALRHIGLYAYRLTALRRYCALPPGQLENLEKLEQLRALEAGMRIVVHCTEAAPPPGIDTEHDLRIARERIGQGPEAR